jgi:hypothetical protein
MFTDDNNNNNDNDHNESESKIEYTINFDANARVIKSIEEHPLFPLAEKGIGNCSRRTGKRIC